LLIVARQQRTGSRAMARTEERLRVLEQRSRDEGDELHRRVLESITREGELRFAVDVLSVEISRLRASLQGLAEPVGAAVAAVSEWRAEPFPAVALEPSVAGPAPSTVDIPLVQRVLVAQESVSVPAAGLPAAAVPVTVVPTVPAPLAAPAPAPVPVPVPVPVDDYETTVRSWVVRELHVDAEAEPVAGLTMRVLDLTSGDADEAEPEPEPEPRAAEPWYARPA
ncbi:MAG: hypothetical protein ACXVXB_16870, partial [Nocardioidaceae bacterium]